MFNIFAIKNKLKKVISESDNGGTVLEKYKFLMNNQLKIQFSNSQKNKKNCLKISEKSMKLTSDTSEKSWTSHQELKTLKVNWAKNLWIMEVSGILMSVSFSTVEEKVTLNQTSKMKVKLFKKFPTIK